MSSTKHAKKNIQLSHELVTYLMNHPDVSEKLPSNASFVVYTLKDKELNEENEKMIPGLIEEGKPVIKAKETNDKNNPWTFTPVAV